MTKAEIQTKIDKNRDEIQSFLCTDLPIAIVKFNITRLSRSNERLIEKLNSPELNNNN